MEALDLIFLGRELSRIGEEALRGGRSAGVATGPALVLRDVFAHPGTSVGEVAARTGLPQGYVSECLGRLRADGVVATAPDPLDGRRGQVTVRPGHVADAAAKGRASVDAAIAAAVREMDGARAAALVAELEDLAQRLRRGRAATAGPIDRQIDDARKRSGPTPGAG